MKEKYSNLALRVAMRVMSWLLGLLPLVFLSCDENQQPLRVYFNVMSANIWQGAKADPGLDKIACYLNNADIVLLQEVDKEQGAAMELTNPKYWQVSLI